MKIAITADLHAHDYTSFARTLLDGMNSRLKRCLNALIQISKYCGDNGIWMLWILGDLFHARTRIDVSVYVHLYRILWKMRLQKMIIVAGNHDQYLKDSSLNSTEPLAEKIDIYSEPGVFDSIAMPSEKSVGIGVIPYSTDKERIRESISTLLQDLEDFDRKILLTHLPISGAMVGSGFRPKEEVTLEDIQANKWDLVLLGHYHRRQRLADNVWYVGAPIQQDFGDEGNDDGFMVLDTETLELETVPIISERFITVKSMDELGNHPGGYFVRLEGKEKAEPAENVHGLVCTSPEVPSFAPRIKLSAKMTMEEMMARYINHLRPELDKDRLMKVGKELTSENKES